MEFWPILKKETSISCSLLENIINPVLSKLIVNLFLIDQLFNNSGTVLHYEDRFLKLLSLIPTAVSSANSGQFDRLDKYGSYIIYTRNSNGTEIPWGTPIVSFSRVKPLTFRCTDCFQVVNSSWKFKELYLSLLSVPNCWVVCYDLQH